MAAASSDTPVDVTTDDAGEVIETSETDAAAEATDVEASGEETAGDHEGDTSETTPDPATGTEQETASETPVRAEESPAPAPDSKPVIGKSLREIEEDLLRENPKLAKGRIPVVRHQAVLTKARAEAEAAMQPLRQAAEEYRSEGTQARLKLAALAESDPDRFMSVVLHDPRYRQVIESIARNLPKADAEPAKVAKAPAAAVEVEEALPEPKPDVLNDDGSFGYSQAQAAAHVRWQVQQERIRLQQHTKALEQKIAAIESQHKKTLEQQTHTAIVQDARVRMSTLLQTARETWAGFKEHEKEIGAELKKPGNERVTLDEAYRRVVMPKLAVTRETLKAQIRKEVLAEINKAPAKAPVTRPSSPDTTGVATSGPLSTEQIVRQQLRRAAASV